MERLEFCLESARKASNSPLKRKEGMIGGIHKIILFGKIGNNMTASSQKATTKRSKSPGLSYGTNDI